MAKVVGYFGLTRREESSLVEEWKMACRSTADVAVAELAVAELAVALDAAAAVIGT
jgi:hypothetical protein